GAACAGSQATHSSTSAASQARRATAATRAARAPAPASVAMDGQVEGVQAAGVGARHAEAEAPEAQLLAGLREVADGGGHQAADGVVLVVVEIGAEALVEVVDGGQRIHHVLPVGLR